MITTDFFIVSKTFAARVGGCHEGTLESSFASIENCRDIELCYTANGVTVEWCADNWTAINRLYSHSTFLVMLADSIPSGLFAERLKRFETTYYEPIMPSDTKGGEWFDHFTQRLQAESENAVEFEHQMVKALATLFEVIKKRRANEGVAGLTKMQKPTQTQKPAMNHLHPFDRPAFYIDSPSCPLSTNQLKQGVASGTIEPETPVHCLEGQPLTCTAGLVVAVNSTGTFHPVKFPSELPHLRHTRQSNSVKCSKEHINQPY